MINIVLYVGFIVLANILAANYIIPLFFGLVVPAGVFAVAPIFTIRDKIHQKYGYKKTFLLVILAAVLSYVLSVVTGSPILGKVTLASLLAFFVSESADTLIFQVMIQQSWMKKVIVSNLISCALDSVIFIWIAFGFSWSFILGQYIVKVLLSILIGFFYGKRKYG